MISAPVASILENRLSFIRPFIGNTPVFELKRAFRKDGVRIFAKLEWQQLGGNVKTRPAFSIIEDALREGKLLPGMRILDTSSGNTAISYAYIAASLNIPVTILMSETASKERSTILKALGVEIIYTDASVTGDASQQMARDLQKQNPELYFYANQFGNDCNWLAHYHTTGEEILNQVPGEITHFTAAMGTSGTLVGTGRKLREHFPQVHLAAIQPDVSTHTIEGWKHFESSIPPAIFDADIVDSTLTISTEETYAWIKKVAGTEGLLLSPSSAGAIAGAVKIAEQIDEGTIVTILPDTADKYGAVYEKIFG